MCVDLGVTVARAHDPAGLSAVDLKIGVTVVVEVGEKRNLTEVVQVEVSGFTRLLLVYFRPGNSEQKPMEVVRGR